MFTKSDKNWLKDNFATKDDLKNFATKDDLNNLSTKKDIQILDRKLKNKFTQLFNFLDKDVMDHKKRIEKIEQILNINSVS